jgi:hypothetical protein
MNIWGFRVAPPAGVRAVQALCDGFATLSEDERGAIAEIVVRIVPSLAAQKDGASALPLDKIFETLKKAVLVAWTGIANPSKLLGEISTAIQQSPIAAELREYCARVVQRCEAAEKSGENGDGRALQG